MSVGQHTPTSKQYGGQQPKEKEKKRSSMVRPHSGILDASDCFGAVRLSDADNEHHPAYKLKLFGLFKQIEREFDLLYQENQTLHDRIDLLKEKLDKENPYDRVDCVDFDHNLSKALSKKLSTSSQKSKTAHKLRAQTSKIVSSFKTPNFNCALIKEYNGHKDGVWEVSVARPGVPVIGTASADHTACIWSVQSSKCLLQYQGHSGSVNSIRFHPAKDLVLTASGDCSAHIWQAALNFDSHGISSEEELEGSGVVPLDDPDGDRLSSEHHHHHHQQQQQRVSTLRTPFVEFGGHTGAISAADWLPGQEQILTASWDRTAILHDVETGRMLTTFTGHDQELTYTATHAYQKLAVTASRDTTFRMWDLREMSPLVSIFQGHSETVTSAVFAQNDRVVSSSDDRSVKVWELRNMRSPTATIRVDAAVNRLGVSSQHCMVAIPHDNRHVRLFDLTTGQRLARLPRSSRRGHNRMVACCAWADDEQAHNGINLFTCGFDRRVFGWSVCNSVKD